METIKDPKQKKIKLPTKSVLISRSRTKKGDEYRTLILKMFNINNPHKTSEFPKLVYEFSNIEKCRIRRLNTSFYLEGNDIVVNDLEELYIIVDKNTVVLKGYQAEIEKRRK